MRVRRTIVAAMFLLAVAAPSAPAAESKATCAPSGAALSVAATDKKFDKDCLAAPAGQGFTIDFDNRDVAIPHNVAIYDTANGKALFKGEVIVGPNKTTYTVPAQVAGTYEFRCDPHDDTMIGTFIVG